jgi:hypothetical protein
MNATDTTPTSTLYGIPYWVALANQTRRFGQCYVHANARRSCDRFDLATATHAGREVRFMFCHWGRSANKFKVYTNYTDTGKPVPSKFLAEIRA